MARTDWIARGVVAGLLVGASVITAAFSPGLGAGLGVIMALLIATPLAGSLVFELEGAPAFGGIVVATGILLAGAGAMVLGDAAAMDGPGLAEALPYGLGGLALVAGLAATGHGARAYVRARRDEAAG